MKDKCEECGKRENLLECHNSYYDEKKKETIDCYNTYCIDCAQKLGYCYICGEFWAGIESFDFGPRYCENCASEVEEDEDDEGFYYFDDQVP
jgi:hypothetical protein